MRDRFPATTPDSPRPLPCHPTPISVTDLFLVARRADGFSPCTISKYAIALHDLARYCQSQSLPTDPLALDRNHLRAWLANLRERKAIGTNRPLSANTQWTYWKSVMAFYSWAVADRYLKRTPCAGIKGPKLEKQVTTPLSRRHLDALLRLCPPNTWWGARDRAIFVCLLTTGCRREELVNMRLQDVDFENMTILVAGKGDRRFRCKQRQVAISQELLKPLLNWLRYRQHIGEGLDALWLAFTPRRREKWQPITNNAVGLMVRKMAKRAGIKDIQIKPHAFRHTFAYRLAQAGMPKRSLQETLGHRDPRSTEVYTNYVDHELVLEEQRRLNPFHGWT